MVSSQYADKKEQSRKYFIAKGNIPVEGSINLIVIGDLISGKLDKSIISIDFIISSERLDANDLKVPNKNFNVISEQMFKCLGAIQSPLERIRCSQKYAETMKQFKIGTSVNIRMPHNNSPKIYGFIRVINQCGNGDYFGVEVLSDDRKKCLDDILIMYEDDLLIESKTRPFINSLQFKTENGKSTRVYARINVLELCDEPIVQSLFKWCKDGPRNCECVKHGLLKESISAIIVHMVLKICDPDLEDWKPVNLELVIFPW